MAKLACTSYDGLRGLLHKSPHMRAIGNNTIASMQGEEVKIILHATTIAILDRVEDQDRVQLFSGHWWTVTTKERLNQFIPVGYRVFQQRGDWFIMHVRTGTVHPWTEGITFINGKLVQ